MAKNRGRGGAASPPYDTEPPTDEEIEEMIERDIAQHEADLIAEELEQKAEARFNAEVGERLRHLREVLGLTLTDVAKRLEVTRQTLSNYESGRTPLRASVIRELAEMYEASCDWILGVKDDIEVRTSNNGRTLYMRESSPRIYPASVKTKDDMEGYDMMLQEKAMEEEERMIAEINDHY